VVSCSPDAHPQLGRDRSATFSHPLTAVKARSIALDADYPTDRAWTKATDKAADVEDEAVDALFETTPTTIAGVASLLDVLGRGPYQDEEGTDDYDFSVIGWRYNGGGQTGDRLLLELADTLRKLCAVA
jgi:hypothetical protein